MNVASFLRQDRRNAERERASGNQRSAGRSGYTANLDGGPLELAERPEMRETLERYERVASVTARAGLSDSLPGGLVPAPGRSARSDKLDAAGFIDMLSQSVGVDIACWHTPPGGRVDERGWQIVFGWIVGSDRDLGCVALLNSPFPDERGFVASYGYESEGVPGVGVLRVSALPCGAWRIVHCWGDHCESERVHHLAGQLIA